MKKKIKAFTTIGESNNIEFIKSGIDNFNDEKTYLDTSCVSNYNITDESYKITCDERPSRANMQPIVNSVWFAKLKNSPKYIIVDKNSNDLLENKIFSTGFCGLKIKDEYFYLLAMYITSEEFNKEKDSLSIGATMQSVNNDAIKNIKIPEFTTNDCENFNKIAKPIFMYLKMLESENKKLVRLKQNYLNKFFN